MFILALVLILEIVLKTIASGQIIVNNYPISPEDSGTGGSAAATELDRSLSFFPSNNLDFGEWAVGTAKSHIVTLVNKNSNRSVFLSSISGKTSTFFSSFFEKKVVPPQGNTTFNVVFLPRNHGNVETNLLIHTSFGQAVLAVKGKGTECPYKLKPLVGIRAPLNSTLHMNLHMYNPHATPIQILEVYSSGGQFQLELPSGTQEGPQALWEIPPLTTKSIIRIRFHANTSGNHTAYIRIKISNNLYDNTSTNNNNNNQYEENVIMVPVECEILPEHGIYSMNPIIDFGRLTTNDLIKIMKLNLTNSGKENYEIINYKFRNINENYIQLDENELSLTLNPKLVTENIIINGELIVQSHLNNKPTNELVELVIGIKAEVYQGSLEYNKNFTVFITGSKNFTRQNREIIIENKFTIPIAVTKLILNENYSTIFNIKNFQPQTLLPGDKKSLFQIALLNETHNLSATIFLETNLTIYEIPIIIATGRLERYTSIDSINFTKLQDENILDFGTIPFGDYSHFGYVILKNINPFPIKLMEWNQTNPRGVYYTSMFLGCLKSDENLTVHQNSMEEGHHPLSIQEKFEFCNKLPANGLAVYELAVQSFQIKTLYSTFRVWTEYEEIVTSVKFVTVMGRLEIDKSKLHFSDCFPGKRCSADISIHSTFLKTMRVNAITVSVPALVFEYQTQNNLPEISANAVTDVGRIYFDPKSVCASRCYIPQESDMESPVKNDFNLNFDEGELRRRTEMYRRFKWNLQTITFTLNTSEVRLFEFNSTVDIVWPKLVRDIQTLPIIEIGQTYSGKIKITNPSDRPLLLDLNLSDPKKAKATILSLPLEVVEICNFCYLTDEDVFHLNDRKHHIILKPHAFMEVDIKFYGRESGIYSTLLHIRNNLTLYEAVWITAKAVHPQFRFGNRKPGCSTPLLFEITEKHLTSCERSRDGDDQPILVSTRRTFTARNTGEVPIRIETFKIGDQTCEGYGFKILDCESFELKANSSKKIDIAFTPDFTTARISRPLILKTNLSYSVNYTLLATIPPSNLEQCAKSMQRPYWELNMRNSSLGMLTIAFIIVIIAAYMESDKILKEHVHFMSRDKGPVQPPLDLRNFAMRYNIDKEDLIIPNGNTDQQDKILSGKLNAINFKKRATKKLNVNGSGSAFSNIKDQSWADELVKKFNTNTQKTKDDNSLTSIPSPVQLPLNGFVSKSNNNNNNNNNEKSSIFTSTPKQKEEKCTPPKKAKENSDKINTERLEKEIKKNTEVEKKNDVVGNLIDNKKLKISLKKAKSVPLPSASASATNTSSQDTSSNTSGSPVNPKPDERPVSKKQHKEKVDSQILANRKSIDSASDQFSILESLPQENGSLNSSTSSKQPIQKKFAKTPGRERKKDIEKVKRTSERKVSKIKGQILQLESPVANPVPSTNVASVVTNNNSIWDPKQASFSHVVAQSIPSNSVVASGPGLYENNKLDINSGPAVPDWNEVDLKNHETFGTDTTTSEPSQNSAKLGPIGTRKSPSSTPVWEPLPTNIQRPIPNISVNNTNTSFFSSNFPIPNNFEYENNEYLAGPSTGFLDRIISGNPNQTSQWQTNGILLLLQQQQLKQQQINSNIAEWQNENRTWTPMGYQGDSYQRTDVTTIPGVTWEQQTLGSVRPPPGLGRPQNDSPIHQQNQIQQQQMLLLQHHQQQQQQQQLNFQTSQSNALLQQTNSTNQIDNNSQVSSNSNFHNEQINSIQAFDPFSSLSEIWSDNWKKNNNNNQQ